MIGLLLNLFLAVGAQTSIIPSGVQPSPANDATQAKSLDPAAPVITISGICEKSSASEENPKPCKTVVTREEFERLTAALAASGHAVLPNARQQMAQTYVDLLAYEQAARSSGLESSPAFQDLMQLVRLRTLFEVYRYNLQARFGAPSREDIDQYYQQNPSEFIEIKLRRFMVPRKNPAAADQNEYEKRSLAVANDMHQRAAKGDDFDQLQREAYARLGLPGPPGTDMGNRRKASLLPDYRDEIFSLDSGQISKMEQEAFSYVIYKIESKRLLSEEAVREEISQKIARERMDKALKEITSGIQPEFNQQYFSPELMSNPAQPASTEAKHSTNQLPR